MLALLTVAAVAAADPLVVNTTYGPVRGRRELDGIRMFRGIPFAAPPLHSNRFRPPQPHPTWTEVRPAVTTMHSCPQHLPGGSEDCLYLHVAVPEHCTPSAPCPVMFWIYGGGYDIGSDNEFGFYNPAELAKRHKTVVVASNYRLSALGFLAVPALWRESGTTVGNWGTLDQQFALQWAHDNVARFGGDPKSVTLFGESAGAISVCWHMGSPGSANLFHRAIIESGHCGEYLFFAPLPDALSFGEAQMARMGCDAQKLGNDTAMLACIRELPLKALIGDGSSKAAMDEALRAQLGLGGHEQLPLALRSLPSVPPLKPMMDWGPTIDGTTLPATPLQTLQSGGGNPVPAIIGNNDDEGTLFVLEAKKIVPSIHQPPKPGDLRKVLLHVFNSTWANNTPAFAHKVALAVDAEYASVDFKSEFWRTAAVLRDFVFACPARRAARALEARGMPVYRYRFKPQYCSDPSLRDASWIDFQLLHCYHSSELYAVWGHAFPEVPLLREFGPRMRSVSDSVEGYWSAFAASGDPNHEHGVTWPKHKPDPAAPNTTSERTQQLAEKVETLDGYLQERCDFWDKLCGKTYCFGPSA